MKFETPKRHILRPTLSINMVQWVLRWETQNRCSSRKMQGPMVEKCCYNNFYFIFKFCGGEEKMKTGEDKRMVKHDFFQKCFF